MKKNTQVFLFVLLIGVAIFYTIYQSSQLEKNHKVTKGKISKVIFTSKSNAFFIYYTINNNSLVYSSSIPYTKYNDLYFLNELLVGKTLTVIYQKGNIENNEMLFLNEDYQKYKIDIPEENKAIISAIDSILNR